MNPHFSKSGINIYTNSNNVDVQQNRSEIFPRIFIYIKFLRRAFSKIRKFLFLLELNKYLKYLFIFYFSFFSSFFCIFIIGGGVS
jgi:hypothetical protein